GGHTADLGNIEPAAVDAAAIIARQTKMHPRNGGDGARGSEQMCLAATQPGAQPVLHLKGLQQVHDVGDHGLEHVAVYEPSTEALGQRDDTHWQGCPSANAALRLQALGERVPPGVLATASIEPDDCGPAPDN